MRSVVSFAGHLRWLAVPAVIGLLMMLGMAVSAEDRQSFAERLDQEPTETAGIDTNEPLEGDDGAGSGPDPGPVDRPEEAVEGDERSGRPEELSLNAIADAGSVGIKLSGDPTVSSLALPRDATGEGGTSIPLTELVRLDIDGELTSTSEAAIRPGDLAFLPADGGLDIVGPDGGRVEIRVEGGPSERSGEFPLAESFTITQVDADGTVRVVQPDASGTIDLGDGVRLQLAGQPLPSPSIWDRATTTPWRWLAAGIAVVLVASVAVAVYLHRRRPSATGDRITDGPGLSPPEQFDDFLHQLGNDPDAARAIRLAFSVAERGLGTLPPRAGVETPFEWYARVVADQPHFDPALSSLCSRFATARFAPQRPTAADRDAAIADLRSLADLASYRAAAPLVGAWR